MNFSIADRQPVKVVYLRYTGPSGDPSIGRFWRMTVTPWLADHGLVDCPRFGMSLDNPRETPPERCRYDACVQLPDGLSLPDAAETTIPGGRYAIANFKGTGSQIGAAWEQLGRAVSAAAAGRFDSQRYQIEHYPRGASYDARTGVFACELCLPLVVEPAP